MNDHESEASNMITWGTAPELVVQSLLEQGVNINQAEKLVARFQEERVLMIVKRGYRRLFLGGVVGVLSAVFIGLIMGRHWPVGGFHSSRGVGILLGFLAGGFFWSLWKMMDGRRDLMRPETVRDNLGSKYSSFF